VPGLQDEWVAIFRLESNDGMKRWIDSPERAMLTAQIEKCLAEPARLLILASDERTEPPVAMVFTHRVPPDRVEDYLGWRRKTIAAQAHHPGYLATEFFQPHGGQDEWVDIVRYASIRDLTEWMESPDRQVLLKELEPIVESMHAHRVTGLEGWFAVNRESGEPVIMPPSWKQALTVLFALYPTVMVLTFLNPLERGLSLAVQMLIGNILSVAFLTWLVMPWVSKFFAFWLTPPNSWLNEVIGLGAAITGLALFVLLFRAI
jgi:antibiotic biosynthesis monooxygenase (ABM) superfamily enzyme